ncbi:MAG: response regulator [Burkholderiales bacterium]
MPDFSDHSQLTELDPLATPLESRGEVDLLLHDLAAPSAPRLPVLVVDSTPIARKFLMQRLHALGYAVFGAESGDQALGMIERQSFGIVFLELALRPEHGIDGLGLCQAIKREPNSANALVPAVVITTGRAGSSSRVHGSLAGCDAYLTKPLLDADLRAALRQVDPLFQ